MLHTVLTQIMGMNKKGKIIVYYDVLCVRNVMGVSVFCNLTQDRVTWEEGTLMEKMPPSDCPGSMSEEYFLE